MPTDYRLRLPGLAEYRQQAAKRRAIAFVDAPDYVAGAEVRPITPATFSMLLATGNVFICGGQITERDVRNFLWFHSPLHAHCGVKDWKRRKRRALHRLDFEMNQPWRRLVGLKPDIERGLAVLVAVSAEIRRLVDDAFADADKPKPGLTIEPVLASLEGYFVHQFAAAYGWTPERTRHTPIAQLFQLSRCIRAARGESVRDAGEDDFLIANLEAKNAALAATKPEAATNGVDYG